MDPLKIYFLFKMVIFHCFVSLPQGTYTKDVIFLVMSPVILGEVPHLKGVFRKIRVIWLVWSLKVHEKCFTFC